jgi:hypothetical protein
MTGRGTPGSDWIADLGLPPMNRDARASCTAGRAAADAGQHRLWVGPSMVGLSGAATRFFRACAACAPHQVKFEIDARAMIRGRVHPETR